MKQLQKSDLKEGEIYVARRNTDSSKYIVKINNNMVGCFNIFGYINFLYFHGNFSSVKLNYFEATPEEKHWLETCIKADNFVSYEKAMKTFVPEYVECLIEYKGFCAEDAIVGKIYKTSVKCSFTINGWNHIFKNHSEKFKPSTKEAYDAQFVVKDPEFVLPEKWCIKFSHDKKLLDWCKENTQTNFTYFENLIITNDNYFHYPLNTTQVITRNSNYTEITFEQFKKHVLKEQLEEPKDKVLSSMKKNFESIIHTVESSEGAIYQLGDKIQVFGGSKNPVFKNKKYFTIQGFRWNNAKTNICAITELHTPNGIGLDKIELYLEPKVKQELSLLEQAKLKYPIGTKFKSATSGDIFTIKNHNIEICDNPNTIVFQTNEQNDAGNFYACVHSRYFEWAEIVDDFVLPEKWGILRNKDNDKVITDYINSIASQQHCYLDNNKHNPYLHNKTNACCSNYKIFYDYTEITFEQFKKYVLKDE